MLNFKLHSFNSFPKHLHSSMVNLMWESITHVLFSDSHLQLWVINQNPFNRFLNSFNHSITERENRGPSHVNKSWEQHLSLKPAQSIFFLQINILEWMARGKDERAVPEPELILHHFNSLGIIIRSPEKSNHNDNQNEHQDEDYRCSAPNVTHSTFWRHREHKAQKCNQIFCPVSLVLHSILSLPDQPLIALLNRASNSHSRLQTLNQSQ
jgi:hypothetical protein